MRRAIQLLLLLLLLLSALRRGWRYVLAEGAAAIRHRRGGRRRHLRRGRRREAGGVRLCLESLVLQAQNTGARERLASAERRRGFLFARNCGGDGGGARIREQAGQSHEIGAPQKAIQHPPKLGGPP